MVATVGSGNVGMMWRISSSNSRVKPKIAAALSRRPYLTLAVLLLFGILPFCFLASSLFRESSSSIGGLPLFADGASSTGQQAIAIRNGVRLGGGGSFQRSPKYRLAIVIPFIGEGPEAIPPYLELFCQAAGGSSSLVDFLLIHNGVLDGYRGDACPDNVRFISLQTMDNFAEALARVMEQKWSGGGGGGQNEEVVVSMGESKIKLAHILSKHLIKYPYVLVEFKPALGHIFADYLQGYSHWGYSDLDIVFGDLARWITVEELSEFDIVTYGYGDQERLYLRGQFTFHKNDKDRINQLWRSCTYLSKMDERFAAVMTGKESLHFESAEGCYSAVILQQNDIRVKYAVKAFTDINVHDMANSHGLYVGFGAHHDRTVVYKASKLSDNNGNDNNNSMALGRVLDPWFERKDTMYANPSLPLQWETGKLESIKFNENPDAKCMFWAQQKYQSKLCIDVASHKVDETDTIYWINGKLYKQRHETAEFPNQISSAPFFHFQEWKRYYRPSQLASFHRSSAAMTFALFKEGAIPIFSQALPSSSSLPYHYQRSANKGENQNSRLPSPLGVNLVKWKGQSGAKFDRSLLPSPTYCLLSGPRKFPPNPPAPQCQFSTSWRDDETVEIISEVPAWKRGTVNPYLHVTLALTLQITAEQAADSAAIQGLLDLVTMSIDRWQGQPCILVVHVAGATSALVSKLRVRLGPGSDLSYALDSCLVAAIFRKEDNVFSRKALLNMAADAAPTRWVVTGLELERGVVISQDTAFFAHRAARVHELIPGNMFVIPQFGLLSEDSEFTISSLWLSHGADEIRPLSKLDKEGAGSCDVEEDKEDDLFAPVRDLWWELTEPFLVGRPNNKHGKDSSISDDESVLVERASRLDNIQLSLTTLLTESKHYDLFAMDVSPIVLIDNLGPRNGMITSELARESEEFGGKQCYNGLRLAQLASMGYQVNVLAGAFAASTGSTRQLAFASITNGNSGDNKNGLLGSSRCDGCFFFDEKHEDILEAIARNERQRPAKAALLWLNLAEESSYSLSLNR
jgi:hypothetical protein